MLKVKGLGRLDFAAIHDFLADQVGKNRNRGCPEIGLAALMALAYIGLSI